MSSKPKLLFVFDHPHEDWWLDGLSAALNLLEKDFEIERFNLRNAKDKPLSNYDFVLAWGAFHSPAERFVRNLPGKKGLCIAGNAIPPYDLQDWDCLFYETQWYYDTVLSRYDKDMQTVPKRI